MALDAVADRALGGHDPHDEAIGEEGHFVDRVVVGRVGHRQHQAIAVERDGQDAKFRRHVGADQRQYVLVDVDEPMVGDAGDHEARLVELGELLLVDQAEPHQALAE